ncbi:regulatory protein RecX [Roseibium sp. RKSG952]|uniref:regulatory protein RecX n=1 Tax=Roseibium sp. RKSG952 TaxID=2529384 RepID=UPI0018AD1977|nr:regulatory protein RecX [Roseibium sp. RKSG952]
MQGQIPEDVDPTDAISGAISFLVENGLINDASFAEMKTRSGKGKGKSRSRITQELVIKGVNKDLAVKSVSDVDDLHQAIRHAQRKRIGPFRTSNLDEKTKRREYGSFARAGFPPSVFLKVFDMEQQEAEDLLFHREKDELTLR